MPAMLPETLADRCAGSTQEQRGQRKGFEGVSDERSLDHWLSCPTTARTGIVLQEGAAQRERDTERKRKRES